MRSMVLFGMPDQARIFWAGGDAGRRPQRERRCKQAAHQDDLRLFIFVRSHTQFVERIRDFVLIGS